jgi:hypothetical protein
LEALKQKFNSNDISEEDMSYMKMVALNRIP